MKKILYLVSLIIVVTACSKNNEDEIPTYSDCIKSQIEIYLKNYPTLPIKGYKASVKKYSYKGEIVYLTDFTPGFPDGAAIVVNEKCESICLLGGIDGNQNDCVDWDKATFIETVWTDPR